MSGHVFAVTGGKGGVGKSTTSINLGVSLRMDGHSVALVDADVEMPNLMEMLGLEADVTLHDVLSGVAAPADAIVEIGQGFAAIPGDPALTGYASIEPERLHTVIDTLAERFDYVILDTGAGLSYDDVFPLALADEVVLVTSPDPPAVENAKRTQAFVNRLARRIRGVVVTKATDDVDAAAIARAFDGELLGVIPAHEVVSRSTASGKPLELIAPNSSPAEAYRQLEANLTDGELPPRRVDPSESAEDGSEEAEPEPEAAEEEPEPVATDDEEEPPAKGGLVGRLVRFVS